MKKLLLALLLLVSLSIPSYAWGPYYGHGYGWGYRGCGPAMFWTGFGLTAGAMVLGTAAAYANPPVYYANPYPVYANPPVVYSQPVVYQQQAPQVIYVQPSQPNVTYIQAPPQQNAVYAQPPAPQQPMSQQPVQQPTAQSYSVKIQNSNGSTTVVPLTQSGAGWIGPQGEYYPSYPSADQIRARYQ